MSCQFLSLSLSFCFSLFSSSSILVNLFTPTIYLKMAEKIPFLKSLLCSIDEKFIPEWSLGEWYSIFSWILFKEVERHSSKRRGKMDWILTPILSHKLLLFCFKMKTCLNTSHKMLLFCFKMRQAGTTLIRNIEFFKALRISFVLNFLIYDLVSYSFAMACNVIRRHFVGLTSLVENKTKQKTNLF